MKTKSKFFKISSVLTAVALVTGCATGEQYKANVYRAGQVNQAQEAKVVRILAVLPAKVEVDNTEAKKNAQMAGAVFGALLGAAGSQKAKNSNTRDNAVVGGAAVGAAAGSMVPDKVLVDGVSLTYVWNSKTLNSVQVGKACEYVPGDAVMVSTSPTETRIQPNKECPKDK